MVGVVDTSASHTQMEDRARFGHHFGVISVFPSTSLQPRQVVESNRRLPPLDPLNQRPARPAYPHRLGETSSPASQAYGRTAE
jgi:hypothetical protein